MSDTPLQPVDLEFTKMEGLGNDFIVLDDLFHHSRASHSISLTRRLCDRRFGIGADQILWLKPAQGEADARMEILNADGSTAEMCGNGIRAAALYLQSSDSHPKAEYLIETLAGVKKVQIQDSQDFEEKQVTVDMGVPGLGSGFFPQGEQISLDHPQGLELQFFEVSMGNPHAVFFVDQVDAFPVEQLGPLVEKHPRFPQRTNVEFVEILDSQTIRLRVWERGAGITLACGTGACAAAVATLTRGLAQSPLTVELPGGRLKISWDGKNAPVFMQGPAREVFRGVFRLE